jgi:acetate kinase
VSSAAATSVVLTLNSGSSSLKFGLFGRAAGTERRLAEGSVERIGAASGKAWLRHGSAQSERAAACPDHRAAFALCFELLGAADLPATNLVGHRIVHGGSEHFEPALIDAALIEGLKRLVPLAPLHLPSAIAGIEAALQQHPALPHVACFDTAFHAGLPEVARRLPVPERFAEVRRYGFHGLSYESVLWSLGPPTPDRLVIAHLGAGASLAAVRAGRALDTTMSFTPSGGIPMGTRSGDLDPGILIYLARQHGLGLDALERLVEQESGLLALGGSSDMQTLLERASRDARAELAVLSFAGAFRKVIGAYAACWGGLDLLVFTGGIG